MICLLMMLATAAQPTIIVQPPHGAAPGHLATVAVSENAAVLARNTMLITRLEQAIKRGASRITILIDKIEQARIARGEPPSVPPPPLPPPPYMELATIAQQTDYIGQLRDQLVHQQRVTPRLERSLRQMRRVQGN